MKKINLLLLLGAFASMANAAVFYVGTTGDNTTGLSWANAYQSIQSALTAATTGDEIWVKQGTYTIHGAANQLVVKEGVNVYGGFAGTETALTERSSDAALTVIAHADTATINFRLLTSSDLNTATTWDGLTFNGMSKGRGVALAGNCVLNNAIVKNCLVANGSGAGVYMSSGSDFVPVTLSNSLIDSNTLQVSSVNTSQLGGAGVFIKSGAKMAEIIGCTISNNTIEGVSATGNLEAKGAGLSLFTGTVRNTVIDGNKLINSANASYSNNNFTGGGLSIVPENTTKPANNILIEGCSITNNSSPSRGGGIIIDPRWSGEYQGNYTFSKTIIANNSTGVVGGGILCTAATKQVGEGWTLNLQNSIIANNSAAANNAGGGVYLNIGCVFNMTNCTVVNNFAGKYGGAGVFFQGVANHTIKASFKDVLMWGNVCPAYATDKVHLNNGGQASTILFSAIQDYDAASTTLTTATLGDNIVLNADNANAAGPNFVSPATESGVSTSALTASWKLTSASPCVDAGDNYLTEDLEGTARPNGDYSDIGAYEYTSSVNTGLELINDKKIFASNGKIFIQNDAKNTQAAVYNMLGVCVKTANLVEGLNIIDLQSTGLFVVKTPSGSVKLMIK